MSLGTIRVTNPCGLRRRTFAHCGVQLPPQLAIGSRHVGVRPVGGKNEEALVWVDLFYGNNNSNHVTPDNVQQAYFPCEFEAGETEKTYEVVEWTGAMPADLTIAEVISQKAPFIIDQFVGSGRVAHDPEMKIERVGHWLISFYKWGRPTVNKGSIGAHPSWWGDYEVTAFRDVPGGMLTARFGHAGLGSSWKHEYEDGGVPKLLMQNVQLLPDGQDQEQVNAKVWRDPQTGHYFERRVFDIGSAPGMAKAFMSEGQAICITGSLIFHPADLSAITPLDIDTAVADGTLPIQAVWDGWPKASFGPHGRVAEYRSRWTPPIDRFAAFAIDGHINDQRKYDQKGWRAGFEMAAYGNPGAAGNQPGVCVHRFADILQSGNPGRLGVALADMRSEFRRSMWLREADGSCLRAESHPELHLWGGDPNTRVPGDHLGKTSQRPYGNQRRTDGTWRVAGQALNAYDHEHWLLSPLPQLAIISGHPMLMRQVDELIELWLRSYSTRGPNGRLFAPRAEARGLQFACWAYWLTGRGDLGQAIADRVAMWMDNCHKGPTGAVCTEVSGPHNTNLPVPWVPWWQEAMLCEALELVAKCEIMETWADGQKASDFASLRDAHQTTVIRCGWGVYNPSDLDWHVLKAGAWLEGYPIHDPIHNITEENGVVTEGTTNLNSEYDTWGVMAARLSPLPKALDIESQQLGGRSYPDQQFERGYLAVGSRPETP